MTEMQRPNRPADWSDSHTGALRDPMISARTAYEVSLSNAPRWMRPAMVMRNLIVAPFGLRTGMKSSTGDFMKALPVVGEKHNQYELGLADRHLTFTIETRVDAGRVSVTTRIWFNHWAGRLYLLLVLVPHKIILKRSLRSLA